MDYFKEEGRLYEFSVLSEAQSDDYAVECFDMSADGGGLIGVLRVGSAGAGTITLRAEIPVRLLRRWLEVAESEGGLLPSET